MIFTSTTFATFFVAVFVVYWGLPRTGLGGRRAQNVLLLAASYVFYGWVHPWFCLLIAGSTIVDYMCGLGMERTPRHKRSYLTLSIAFNLGLLATFKYFDFFAASISNVLEALGLGGTATKASLGLLLPVGISFYTFQTLSYTIDIYRRQLTARRNFVDFALFVSFFPQLVAGPIERARRFLPQIETPRRFDAATFFSGLELIAFGYLKKLVVADNIGPRIDQIFALQSPTLALLAVGAAGFAVQIYADFSAYTDIARGVARLLGFDLVINFRSPYLAVSPSDFWRRWHISFSTWIRDYLYIPLGGSRTSGRLRFLGILIVTLGLSGLWHGAAWHFVLWGVYHAVLVYAYHAVGCGGRWVPRGALHKVCAWALMLGFTLAGWLVFRADDLGVACFRDCAVPDRALRRIWRGRPGDRGARRSLHDSDARSRRGRARAIALGWSAVGMRSGRVDRHCRIRKGRIRRLHLLSVLRWKGARQSGCAR